MSPVTHLLASWILAAKTTDNPRDCRIVTLVGITPDADGLGLIVDLVNQALGRPVRFAYLEYHHFLLHGVLGVLLITALAVGFARNRGRVALVSLIALHLHVLCDLVGSRGPTPQDLWPIYYLGPLTRQWPWLWGGQWALDAWPNRLISVTLLGWAIGLAVQLGHSVVGVANRRADAAVVAVLRKWSARLGRTP